MMRSKEGNTPRKIRNDKKVDVKPTISIKLKQQIYKLSDLSGLYVKDLAETLIERGQISPLILDEIHDYFRRNYLCPPALHRGYLERPRLKLLLPNETGKITIKFPQPTYDQLCQLSYALDLPPTTTTAVLLKKTIHNREFMFEFVRSLKDLNNAQKNTVHEFLRHVWGAR
jgi:hypothetical protein